ncbi:MAG: sulfotransferase [Pseudorhodoplanes sp.]|nr:sulfotransferase [Pseudorhodoplanes sp.]
MRTDHVFIMSPPRSGTRMLTRALGRSPDTYLITEHKKKSVYIPEERNQIPDREFWLQTFGLPKLPVEEIDFDASAFARLNALWSADAGDKRLVIKNPNNIVRAREIRRAFPDAPFLWLVRNPWAVIQSMMGGNEAGKKNPMFLGAREILRHEDPVLRAAASWAYSVAMMNELMQPADLVTRYEDLVANPRAEIARITRHLSIQINDDASAVPERRKEDFRLARYLLRRSPVRDRILQTIAPAARQLGYPLTPPGFPGDDRILAASYFFAWLKEPNRRPVYGYPTLQRFSKAVRGK